MPRWLMFLLFLIIAAAIMAGMHFYLFRRLVADPALPAGWHSAATALLIVMALSVPLSFLVVRFLSGVGARFLLYPIYIWLGVLFLTFTMLLGLDLLKVLIWFGSRLTGYGAMLYDPAYRVLIARLLAAAVAGIVLVTAIVAVHNGLRSPQVKRLELRLDNLPPEFDGFTIAQLSDLHLSPLLGRRWLEEVVAATNALEPDLVAITGDLADGTVAQLGSDAEPIAGLEAPHGVFFVTGNHEYFFDLEGWLSFLTQRGVRVLRNERIELLRGDAAIDLAGVDDHDGRHLASGHGTDLEQALEGRDPQRAVVLLAHQPRAIKQASQLGVDLVLSGHTHGGQVWPFYYAVYLQQPYISGLHERNGTQLYVSHGTGFWGPPMRLGTTAEITLITLRQPEQP
ncbi:MAG: metallophosphoesterase [Candidatus Alcyoniella australis]|nr:metallophosphoesterase [Candidatus Alcyoniella australis]